MASKVITIRIDPAEHDLWRDHARARGLAFNRWARAALADQYKLEHALENEQAAQRVGREALKSFTYPQKHPQGKKTYKPDLR